MTSAPDPRARRRSGKVPVYAGSLAVFAGVSAFLGVQMADGKDPALGRGAWPAPPATQQLVVRRVIVTRRVNIAGLTADQAKKQGVKRIVVPGGGSGPRDERSAELRRRPSVRRCAHPGRRWWRLGGRRRFRGWRRHGSERGLGSRRRHAGARRCGSRTGRSGARPAAAAPAPAPPQRRPRPLRLPHRRPHPLPHPHPWRPPRPERRGRGPR